VDALQKEIKLKRDDWMLLPPSTSIATPDAVSRRPRPQSDIDESLTEVYGDSISNSRNLGGGIDFFSSLGTEKQKPPRPSRPDPDKVIYKISIPFIL